MPAGAQGARARRPRAGSAWAAGLDARRGPAGPGRASGRCRRCRSRRSAPPALARGPATRAAHPRPSRLPAAPPGEARCGRSHRDTAGRGGRAAARSAGAGGAPASLSVQRQRSRLAGIAARTRVRRRHEHEAGREDARRADRARSSRAPSSSGWRSASRAGPRELGELVEEQHAVVGEASPPRAGARPAADEAGRPRSCGAARETAAGHRARRRRAGRRSLWIRVTSSASSGVSGGRIAGRRRASIVLPVPGGPSQEQVVAAGRRDLERATPARRARATSAGRRPPRAAPGRPAAGVAGGAASRRRPARSADLVQRPAPRRRRSRPPAPPRRRARAGTTRPSSRLARAPSATASAPRHGADLPAQRQLPEHGAARPARAAGTCPLAASTPTASARSKPGPDLAQVRGREVGRDPAAAGTRSRSSGARRARARATRAPRRREADDRERGQARAHVDLDADAARLEAVDGEGGDAGEHADDARRRSCATGPRACHDFVARLRDRKTRARADRRGRCAP